jgi:uncharacterized protein YbjQ (UPF0145 family)
MKDEMIISTLENVPNMNIEWHFGLVFGSVIIGKTLLGKFVTNIKSMFGSIDDGKAERIREARQEAINNMLNQAKNLSANAVICVRFAVSSYPNGNIEFFVYGTAVKMVKF